LRLEQAFISAPRHVSASLPISALTRAKAEFPFRLWGKPRRLGDQFCCNRPNWNGAVVEQPFALGKAGGRVGIGGSENVGVAATSRMCLTTACHYRTHRPHVAHTDHGEICRLIIAAQFTEMALHRFPGAAR
jgi:hypothetical protein